ncbi:SRPBCC family protein [Actinocrinis puniceicyclus]|uniref:SRPBCC family protein n=1 Tax=Actinocrinis puniceicyclus TaxID=977794 RepID=A0A8J7WFV1_9ACTN|nr:SRPBCC family protein [Actinocrinis puniceicyclus]MBS2961411.1 SRPBCC family protein [Actinocrinis puniceicyclus]
MNAQHTAPQTATHTASAHPALELEIPPGLPVINYRRFVKAPPDLVFTAFTDPRHLRNWWGPRRMELVVCEVDLRVGGGYRFVSRAPDGQEFGFHGEYREIDRPNRLVNTFVFEGAPDHYAVDTAVFERVEGGTLIRGESVHDSVEARDAHVAAGMEPGMIETMDRLDDLVAAAQTV